MIEVVLRLWLVRLLPFLGRWMETSPACCGVCPTCLTATAGGLTITMVSSKLSSNEPQNGQARREA
jgi:hypothetical protein